MNVYHHDDWKQFSFVSQQITQSIIRNTYIAEPRFIGILCIFWKA